MPSYHLSIETPTPLVLGVGVMFVPVACFVTFVLFGRRLSGTNLYRRVLTKHKKSSRPSGSVSTAPLTSPLAETSSGVSLPGTSSSLPLGGQGKREGSQGAPGVLSGGAARSRSSERGGGASGRSSGARGRAFLLLLLLRERAKWELPARCRLPFPALPTSLSLPNSHRTFHDVRVRGRLRSLATACYPPVVLDLRIEKQGRIRGPGHVGVALVDVAIVVALDPLPGRGQEVESVDSGHHPLGSLLVPARAGCGRGRGSSRSRSSDRYRSHRDRMWRDRWWSVDRSRSRHQRTCFPARWGDRRDR